MAMGTVDHDYFGVTKATWAKLISSTWLACKIYSTPDIVFLYTKLFRIMCACISWRNKQFECWIMRTYN